MELLNNVLELYQTRSEFFIKLLIEHIVLSSQAIIIITILGLTLGILITKNQKVATIVLSLCSLLYTIPSIALFGFLVAITGIGNTTALIALVIYGMLPMIRNTYVGLKEVDPQIIESAVAMGSTPRQLLFRVQLPLAMPVIVAGFKTMVVMTIALTGIASFIGAGGLGVALWRGITTNSPEMTVAGSLLVAILAVGVDFMIGIIEKKTRKKVLGV